MAAGSCSHVAEHLKKVKPRTKGCEECLKMGEQMAASAHVPGVRPRGLLRLIAESPRAGAFPRDAAPADPVRRARRRLALVLHRRGVPVTSALTA